MSKLRKSDFEFPKKYKIFNNSNHSNSNSKSARTTYRDYYSKVDNGFNSNVYAYYNTKQFPKTAQNFFRFYRPTKNFKSKFNSSIPNLMFTPGNGNSESINFENILSAEFDIYKIISSKDLSPLEANLEALIFSDFECENEQLRNLINIFKESSEYLLQIQNNIEKENNELEESYVHFQENTNLIEEELKNNKQIIHQNKYISNELDHRLNLYKTVIEDNSGMTLPKLINGKKYFLCKICYGKKFSSNERLRDHYSRRHHESLVSGLESDNPNIHSFLDNKITKLKEDLTLSITNFQIQSHNHIRENNLILEKKLEEIKNEKEQMFNFNGEIKNMRKQLNIGNYSQIGNEEVPGNSLKGVSNELILEMNKEETKKISEINLEIEKLKNSFLSVLYDVKSKSATNEFSNLNPKNLSHTCIEKNISFIVQNTALEIISKKNSNLNNLTNMDKSYGNKSNIPNSHRIHHKKDVNKIDMIVDDMPKRNSSVEPITLVKALSKVSNDNEIFAVPDGPIIRVKASHKMQKDFENVSIPDDEIIKNVKSKAPPHKNPNIQKTVINYKEKMKKIFNNFVERDEDKLFTDNVNDVLHIDYKIIAEIDIIKDENKIISTLQNCLSSIPINRNSNNFPKSINEINSNMKYENLAYLINNLLENSKIKYTNKEYYSNYLFNSNHLLGIKNYIFDEKIIPKIIREKYFNNCFNPSEVNSQNTNIIISAPKNEINETANFKTFIDQIDDV